MAWTPYHTKLSNILADLYQTDENARQVLQRAGLKLGNFNLRGAPRTMWHGIVSEADKNGDVPTIVAIALEDFSNHTALLQLESNNTTRLQEDDSAATDSARPSTSIDKPTTINMGGGTYIAGNVNTGGDFVGRDKKEITGKN